MSKKEVARALMGSRAFRAGAKRRKRLSPADRKKAVMREFERGTLHSGSGQIVTRRDQAIAIALSEARRK